MPRNSKIIWTEGLFVQTQHFQQQDRYLEHLVENRCSNLHSFPWGMTQFTFDKSLFGMGKFALQQCQGVFPDGTVFDSVSNAALPAPLDINQEINDQIVYLCIPLQRPGLAEIDNSKQIEPLARYQPDFDEVTDNNAGRNKTVTLQVGQLRLKLLLHEEDRGHYSTIPLAKIREASPEKGIILDDTFIASCLHCQADEALYHFVTELQGLLKNRADALSGRVSDASRGGVSEVADFLMLQLVNRYEARLQHLASLPNLHPENLYATGVEMAAELSTFTRVEKRPLNLGPYQHDQLSVCLNPLMTELRRSLSTVLEQNAIPVAWEEHKYGVRIAKVNDAGLFSTAKFILAVKAEVKQEMIQNQFRSQVKIGPVDYIRQLVNSGLAGIPLNLLPSVPRQIPYHAGFTYFQLDSSSQYWKGLVSSKAFALHVSGDFPGLELELWAIKE